MGQSGQALGDRPEVTQAQGIHRQAAQRGQDADAIALAVAMRVLTELGVAGPVPGVFDGPMVADVLQQCFGCGPETRDVVTGLIDGLALTDALAEHCQDRGAAGPVLHHPLWCRHAAQGPGEITATFAFSLAGLKRRLPAVGQPITDHLKPLAATVFDGDQEVGATLLEVEEKGRFACSASACTNIPVSSARSRSSRSAEISLPASVA